jgi:acetyl esterase
MVSHAFRLHRGQDLLLAIEAYASSRGIKAAAVLSAVGCVTVARLRDAGGVEIRRLEEDLEIVSLMGTVSAARTHLHASFSRRDLSTLGGHLVPGCLVNTTAEIVLLELEGLSFGSEPDPATGYEELAIEGQPYGPAARDIHKSLSRPGLPTRLALALLPRRPLGLLMRAAMGSPNSDIARRPLRSQTLEIPGPAGGVRLLVTSPEGRDGLGERPLVVYLHGGGWIGGRVEVVANICRAISDFAGAVVVNVDYRLAPEPPFPGGLDDCWAALAWAAGQARELGADPDRLFVAGDSAGGNLAAVLALLARERKGPSLAGQLLLYPLLDIGPGAETRSYFVRSLPRLYLGARKDLAGDWRVSPLRASDLSGLAPAYVLIPEYCYLRAQGEAYARRLSEAGVAVVARHWSGLGHAFLERVGVWPQAGEALEDMAAFIASRGATGKSAAV